MYALTPRRPDAGHPGLGRANVARALVALLACLVLGPADPVAGQQRTPTPSAKELWEAYPLHPSPEPALTVPTPTPADGRRVSAPAAASDDGEGAVSPLLAGLVLALGAMALLWTFRPGHAGGSDAREQDAPKRADGRTAAPRPAGQAPASEKRAAQERDPRAPPARKPRTQEPTGGAPRVEKRPAPEPARGARRAQTPLLNLVKTRRADAWAAPAAVPAPPAARTDPRRAWTAEIRWVESDGRFAAFARTRDQDEETVVAESPSLEWPPTSPAAVQALSDAVEELERTLLAAGWTSLPAGSEWYAKRLAWKPRLAAPAAVQQAAPRASAPPATAPPAAVRTGRFRRRPAWPEGSDQMWRCELRWDPGLVNSRFEALAYAPGERQGRAIGGSATFRWLMRRDPDPAAQEYRTELGRLTAELQAAGWDYVGRGTKWYSACFVWRRPGTPPDHIEPQPQLVGRGPRRLPERRNPI
jgi:hypothetical protein